MSKAVIKNTLDAFFGVRIAEGETENNNVGISIDEVDTEILSEAIADALKKENQDENTNQFEQ